MSPWEVEFKSFLWKFSVPEATGARFPRLGKWGPCHRFLAQVLGATRPAKSELIVLTGKKKHPHCQPWHLSLLKTHEDPWDSHGELHGDPAGTPWDPMCTPWDRGDQMGTPCGLHGGSLGTPWGSMGTSWGSMGAFAAFVFAAFAFDAFVFGGCVCSPVEGAGPLVYSVWNFVVVRLVSRLGISVRLRLRSAFGEHLSVCATLCTSLLDAFANAAFALKRKGDAKGAPWGPHEDGTHGDPWGPHGDPMGTPWDSMGTPWGPHGAPWGLRGDPWGPHGGPMGTGPMGTPWGLHGDPMELHGDFVGIHGGPMGAPWGRDPWGLHGEPMGTPWGCGIAHPTRAQVKAALRRLKLRGFVFRPCPNCRARSCATPKM